MNESRVLFHATYPDNEEVIREVGILPSSDVVYLSNTARFAASFIKMRQGMRIGPVIKVVDSKGRDDFANRVDQFTKVTVFEVDASRLNDEMLEVVPEPCVEAGFCPESMVTTTYRGVIPADAIVGVEHLPITPSSRGDDNFF
jgi:hypothetical protein